MSDKLKDTHLMEWLKDGYTHCQHGSKDWCQSYLNSAHDYIEALERERDQLRAAVFGSPNYDPSLTSSAFVAMARTTDEARIGARERAEALEAELEKAREEALEEAAKVAETGGHYVVENVDHLGRFSMHSGSSARAVWSGLDGPAIAAAIRALSQDKEAREAAPVDNVNSGDKH